MRKLKNQRAIIGIGICLVLFLTFGTFRWLHQIHLSQKNPDTQGDVRMLKHDAIQTALALNWTAQEYFYGSYSGPVIQIALVNEKGILWHYDNVTFQPLNDKTSYGGNYSFEGCDSLKLEMVDKPALSRAIRVGIRYKAWKTWDVDGAQFVQHAEFTVPKSELANKLYRLALVFPTPPRSGEKKQAEPPKAFPLKGIAPLTNPGSEVSPK